MNPPERNIGGRPKGSKGQRYDGLWKRCPCARRRWSDCEHSWHFHIGWAGGDYRGTLNKAFDLPRFKRMTRSEAETYVTKLRIEIQEGRYSPKSARASEEVEKRVDVRLTFEDVAKLLVEEFKADPNRRPHRAVALEMQLACICRTLVPAAHGTTVRFGDIPMTELRTPHIEAFRTARRQLMQDNDTKRLDRAAKLAEGISVASLPAVTPEIPRRARGEIGLNRHLEVVRRVVSFAILRGHYDRESPFLRHGKSIVRFAPQKPRTRRLLPGEEERLLGAASRHLQALIIAALETGCRKGELLSLQWRDVLCNEKGEPRTLSLRSENTKTDTARTVPISPRLAAVLEMRRTAPDGKPLGFNAYVFGNDVGERVGEFKLAWRGACQRAEITGLTFHDLRRSFASRLLENNVSLLAISRLLGHRRVTVTDTYLSASSEVVEREFRSYHERMTETTGSGTTREH